MNILRATHVVCPYCAKCDWICGFYGTHLPKGKVEEKVLMSVMLVLYWMVGCGGGSHWRDLDAV